MGAESILLADVPMEMENFLLDKYSAQRHIIRGDDIEDIPSIYNPYEHVMGEFIRMYIEKGIFGKDLSQIINKLARQSRPNEKILVLGICEEHLFWFEKLRSTLGISNIRLIRSRDKSPDPTIPYINKLKRPKLWRIRMNQRESYAYLIFPGEEYIIHYASMIKSLIEQRKRGLSYDILEIIRFPEIEKTVYIWTGIKDFYEKVLQVKIFREEKTTIILLGWYRRTIKHIIDGLLKLGLKPTTHMLQEWPDKRPLYHPPGFPMFMFDYLYEDNKIRILCFQFLYSYWGDIIERIAEGFYESGVSEILHIANAGSIRNPNDITLPLIIGYEKRTGISWISSWISKARMKIRWGVLVPSQYFHYESVRNLINLQMCKTPNSLLMSLSNEDIPKYTPGAHICVRTTLEETFFPFVAVATNIGAISVDTEAFHIAKAAENVNKRREKSNKVMFGSIYFASDYIKKNPTDVEFTLATIPRDLLEIILDATVPLVTDEVLIKHISYIHQIA